MARVFVIDGREFADPDPTLTVEEVQAQLADFFGEVGNASYTEVKRGEDTVYQFRKQIGTKGS